MRSACKTVYIRSFSFLFIFTCSDVKNISYIMCIGTCAYSTAPKITNVTIKTRYQNSYPSIRCLRQCLQRKNVLELGCKVRYRYSLFQNNKISKTGYNLAQ